MGEVTTDLAKFGAREKYEAERLLKAMREQGLPEDFYDEDVTIMMNTSSGHVFLINADYQVAMLNGDVLESVYTTPYDGQEGFFDELLEILDEGWLWEDIDFMLSIAPSDKAKQEIRKKANRDYDEHFNEVLGE